MCALSDLVAVAGVRVIAVLALTRQSIRGTAFQCLAKRQNTASRFERKHRHVFASPSNNLAEHIACDDGAMMARDVRWEMLDKDEGKGTKNSAHNNSSATLSTGTRIAPAG